jgi:putative ABC transport system ATP-binding protein
MSDNPNVLQAGEAEPAPSAAGGSGAVLEARGVSKSYVLDEVVVDALREVNLEVRRGEMLAIMGPSGSGKSTLMHIVGLLDHPTTGVVTIDGEDVSGMSPNALAAVRNRRIGFVFQSFNLLARTTATSNVELPLIYAGVSGSERARRAKAALERVGLGNRLRHMPNQLSGGQQQRVAIARALITEPSIVLADEPTGNLDSRSGVEVMQILQELNDQGITVVLVTHDARVARHAQRVVHIADGSIVLNELVEDRIIAEAEIKMLEDEAAHETDAEGLSVNVRRR